MDISSAFSEVSDLFQSFTDAASMRYLRDTYADCNLDSPLTDATYDYLEIKSIASYPLQDISLIEFGGDELSEKLFKSCAELNIYRLSKARDFKAEEVNKLLPEFLSPVDENSLLKSLKAQCWSLNSDKRSLELFLRAYTAVFLRSFNWDDTLKRYDALNDIEKAKRIRYWSKEKTFGFRSISGKPTQDHYMAELEAVSAKARAKVEREIGVLELVFALDLRDLSKILSRLRAPDMFEFRFAIKFFEQALAFLHLIAIYCIDDDVLLFSYSNKKVLYKDIQLDLTPALNEIIDLIVTAGGVDAKLYRPTGDEGKTFDRKKLKDKIEPNTLTTRIKTIREELRDNGIPDFIQFTNGLYRIKEGCMFVLF
ncbi:hypothetical protein Bb109J_c2493 [Bdellovibrio bacteriovorus]|uniref:hypothetical protein n=1 Tax=Bdellovibrio bacteriovorus TaxID=959 RepID=UPI00045BFAF6|nr:hypothetical protein [Bdellovibrio bacteriovorus]AHZ85181.1 hypothetical protein EP01_09560 [Bdellovibrio bacteriovorus]BEV69073.1 hypothetical protein Bb109J_c2493 [Bdellovibrio bacteriovorus]